jgi:hypothetical protein
MALFNGLLAENCIILLKKIVAEVITDVSFLIQVSIGTRCINHDKIGGQTHMALTFNPVMGHLSSSYTTMIWPGFAASTRFDFNLYSIESDLVVGGKFCSKEKPDEWIQLRAGMDHGISMVYQRPFDHLILLTGFAVGLNPKHPNIQFGIEISA